MVVEVVTMVVVMAVVVTIPAVDTAMVVATTVGTVVDTATEEAADTMAAAIEAATGDTAMVSVLDCLGLPLLLRITTRSLTVTPLPPYMGMQILAILSNMHNPPALCTFAEAITPTTRK